MRSNMKFSLLFLFGIGIFFPFFYLALLAQQFLLAIPFLVGFLLYCYFLYSFVCRRLKAKYPLVPPDGRMDIYMPRTNIPRPIHEDVRRYPEFFKVKKKRRYMRRTRVKKKA